MAPGKSSNYFVHTLLRARDWQHRPQFDEVCDWWQGSSTGSQPVRSSIGRGICALVGMGGAGKTAIADRFLNELLDVGRVSNLPSNDTEAGYKPAPPVFVYSFYDDDKPESFFRHLQIWLEGNSSPDKQKSPTQLMFDIQQHEGLIILDGLEKVQESGARGGFGRLTSPSLRDLLNHIASGSARELSVLVTSRFPLTDLRDSQPRFFRTIDIDEIEVEAGIDLLRARGVRGNDMQLAPIVEHCGRHALTIDLAGGYIKEYGHGDPSTPLNLGTAEELQAEAEQEPDDDKRAVLKQGIRFARIAQRYREAMLCSDEAALALLERICLFRLGVDCETLVAIFTGPAAEKVSGESLARLDADQLQKKLDWLVKMRIVEHSNPSPVVEAADAATHYNIHPAVRDGFLGGISRDMATANHEAIRRGIEKRLQASGAEKRVRLESKPGEKYPTDHATLDLMEEIVHHALATGNTGAAWGFYQNRIGGCKNLIAGLNDYARACRVTDAILRRHASGDVLPDDVVTILRSDYGFSCLELGNVAAAGELLQKGVDDCYRTKNANLKTLSRNLACAIGESGNLKRALDTLRKSLQELHDPGVILNVLLQIADIEILRGTVHITVAASEITRHTEDALPSAMIESLPIAVRHDSLDIHRFLDEFKQQVEELRSRGVENAPLAEARLDLSDRLLWHGDVDDALVNVSLAEEWAIARDARRFLCHCSLARARIVLSQHQRVAMAATVNEFARADADVTRGLTIARDCGYGLYHIDLLLERARLHLLRGDAGAALDDIEVALDTGIPNNEETGQVELLAANHEQCGYAWPIPFGLQLRGEALLLQAAREVISVGWAVPTDQGTLDPIDVTAMGTAHPTIGQLVEQAQQLLLEALDRWHDLRDPEPTEDNNFKIYGKAYNSRAVEAHQVLDKLARGVLSRYPLTRPDQAITNNSRSFYPIGDDMEGLNKIANCDNGERAGDVVFVHGLDGDAYSTWHPQGDRDSYWPSWLGQEFPNVGVWSLGYAVNSSAWKGHSMPLSDRATNALDLFELDGLGKRPIVFVCHSLGGLLVKQALRHACDSKNPPIRAIAAQTKAIVFLSTPHSGSDLANWVKHIGTILRSTVSVDELEAHHPRLRELNDWYRDHVAELGVTTFVYCEKLKTKGILVVDETTANPGIVGVKPVPLDEDHISICKPPNLQSRVYRRVKRLIEDCVLNPQ